MLIKTACRECGWSQDVHESLAGRRLRCQKCGAAFSFSTDPGTPPAATEPLSSPAAAQAWPVEEGLFAGRYRFVRILGEGGMGRVELHRDTWMDREVALKVPNARSLADPRARERFIREARTLASLKHPNVCQIYNLEILHDPIFLTMEYVEGLPLSDLIQGERRLPPGEAAELIQTLAQALDAVHARGVIHRDLKPSNVLIVEGRPVLIDFGLALAVDSDADRSTVSGNHKGTFPYMSPEQANARPGEIGTATDVYTLGVIFYRLLTGRLPFWAESTLALLSQILMLEPDPPSTVVAGLDPRWDEIVLKAMAKRPPDRFANMKEFARAIEQAVGRAPVGGNAGTLSPIESPFEVVHLPLEADSGHSEYWAPPPDDDPPAVPEPTEPETPGNRDLLEVVSPREAIPARPRGPKPSIKRPTEEIQEFAPPARRRLRLVELALILGLFGLGAGLGVPALLSARAEARRLECVANLKQIGLALSNYNDTYASFPLGASLGTYEIIPASEPSGKELPPSKGDFAQNSNIGKNSPFKGNNTGNSGFPSKGGQAYQEPAAPTLLVRNMARCNFSAHAQILAQLEQIDTYYSLNFWFGYSSEPGNLAHEVNRTAASTPIAVFACPVDPVGAGTSPFCHYPMSIGTTMGLAVKGQDVPTLAYDRTSGFLGMQTATRISEIADGTSNTIAASEATVGAGGAEIIGRASPTLSAVSLTTAIQPNTFSSDLGAGDERFLRSCEDGWKATADPRALANAGIRRGHSWALGLPGTTLFTTIVTPNRTRASWSLCATESTKELPSISNADSNHTGGVNAVMVDGSVRFVRDSIDAKIWRYLGTKSGGEIVAPQDF